MSWKWIKEVIVSPLSYIRDIHSEHKPDSHGRWTVTTYMGIAGAILGHAQSHHLPLDPTINSALLGIGALVLGRTAASKIFAEKPQDQTKDSSQQ